jgi:ribosomal protein RSM22 (predicted rRNA methylase)
MTTSLTTETLIQAAIELIFGEQRKEQYLKGDLPGALFTPYLQEISKLSEAYVNQRAARQPLRDIKAAEAYALYFMPINFAKIVYLLSKIPGEFWQIPRTVLDIGCGTGTGLFAASPSLVQGSRSFGIDKSEKMREVCGRLAKLIPNTRQHSFSIAQEIPAAPERFDLIIAANLLNELEETEKTFFLNTAAERLSADGFLLLLEPALSLPTRALMKQRDLLVNDYKLFPLFPCTHNRPCPMLSASEDDWCHGSLKWERPKLIRMLDQLSGFNKHRIKYAGHILSKENFTPGGARVVNFPVKNKRGLNIITCSQAGLQTRLFPKGSYDHYDNIV